MGYGVTSSSTTVAYASVKPGDTPRSGSTSVVNRYQSRSGSNGRSTIGVGVKRVYTMILKHYKEKYVVNVWKKIPVDQRLTGGDPLWGVKYIRNPSVKKKNGPRPKEDRTHSDAAVIDKWIEEKKKTLNFSLDEYYPIRYQKGFTRKRKRIIYKMVLSQFVRYKKKSRLIRVPKLIKIPPVTYPDLRPHPLIYTYKRIEGLDQSAQISYSHIANPTLHPPGNTITIGMVRGVHAGVLGDFGENPDQIFQDQSALYYNELHKQSLYRLADNARDGIANISNMIAEREGLKRTMYQWAIGSLSTLVEGKRAIVRAIGDTLSDPRKIASAYLSYIYGLKPAINDFSNLLREFTDDSKTWRKYRGVAKKSWDTSTSYRRGPSKIEVTRVYDLTVKNQVIVLGDIAHPSLSSHSSINLLEAGWETIPFSFVADWFIPIGSFLASQDLFSGVTYHSSYETRFYRERVTVRITHSGVYDGYKFSGPTQVFTAEYVSCIRTLTAAPSLPFPDVKNPFSKGHALNSLFLLISNLKR